MKRQRVTSPTQWIETVLHDPETNRPFELLPAERVFLEWAFKTGPDGKLLFPELVYGCPKKSGKTTLAAIITITMVVLYGGKFGEAICAANSHEQSAQRVFRQIVRIIKASPQLADEARITQDKVFIGGAEILAVPTDAGTAAGANPVLTCFDELWDFRTEAAHRFFDEMVPPPTRKTAARLTVSYAGYVGESVLLEGLYNRGMAQPEVAPSLRAGDGILMFWTHEPIAPWQDAAWIEQMRRSLRPLQFSRMIRNEWVSSESSFIDMADFDLCVDEDLRQEIINKGLPIWVGFDGSVNRDWTAVVAVTIDRKTGRLRLVWHKLFKPTATREVNFEDVFDFIRQMSKNFSIQSVAYDPFQLASVSQRLASAGVPMAKLTQSSSNLTAIGSVLYEAIKTHTISFYEDADLRLSMSRAVAVESGSSGWKITKSKQSHKVDFVVALAMACHAAMSVVSEPQTLTLDSIRKGLEAFPGLATVGCMNNNGFDKTESPDGRLGERQMAQLGYRGGNSMFSGYSGRQPWKPPPGFR